MTMLPLVSVCIPTFNGAEYLSVALGCVQKQTYPNLEVVFSDDGSKDGTVEIIDSFARTSPFPAKILHHNHTSLAGNWNNCVAHASGEYIKFLFQDDLIRPDCILKLMEVALSNQAIGLVFSSRDIIWDETRELSWPAKKILEDCRSPHDGWSDLRQIQSGLEMLADPALLKRSWNKIGEPSMVILKRQSIVDVGGFDPSLCQLIDLDMWYRIMTVAHVGFIDEKLSSFRIHDKQLSSHNIKSGEAKNDTIFFAIRVIHSNYFRYLHPLSQRKLLRAVKPPSVFKRFRRHFKKWARLSARS